jgi:hypothetical protein
MDDKFMYSGRRAPSTELVRRVREIPRRAAARNVDVAATGRWRARFAIVALSLLGTAGAFALPEVREGARAFLDVFRVVNFAAVPVDGKRLSQLANRELDLPRLIARQVEVLSPPSEPLMVPDATAAAAAVGTPIRLPAWLPVGWEQRSVAITPASSFRFTADTKLLNSLLQSLSINDLSLPQELNGTPATVRLPAATLITWNREEKNGALATMTLLQAQRPEVSLPAGLDLPVLAEIGLRLLGLDRREAHLFAQRFDWRTTLIVPVPTQVASFRQVNVQGNSGLLIVPIRPQQTRPKQTGDTAELPETEYRTRLLLWSAGDSVFALGGNLGADALLEIGQSLQ